MKTKKRTVSATEIARILKGYRYNFGTEIALQDGIERVLKENGIGHRREVRLGDAGIIDFMVERIGVEVKIKGSPSAVGRQVLDYLGRPELDEIVVVTSRALSASYLRVPELAGKKVTVVDLWTQNF